MKAAPILLVLALPLSAQDGVIDLTALYNYANQPVPAYINRDNTPPNNEITDLGTSLGRVLFYDKRLSRDNSVSCSSCHQQENAFGDLSLASTGVAGTTGRHSMRLVNARFGDERRFFWDERANSLEAQTTQPIQDHVEMGFSGADGDPGFADLVAKLSGIEEYHVLFTAVYGDDAIDEDRIQRALAQFVRSIQSFDSRYDEGRTQVPNDGANFPNFTASENRGKNLFLAPPGPGAGCAACHQPPEFSITPGSGNNGVVGVIGGGTDTTVTRSPSLRDIVNAEGTPHGPFMHDGSLATLEAVIGHYNNIPAIVPGLDPRLIQGGGPGGPPGMEPQQLNLTGQERADLVAFLETLTGSGIYSDPKWSDPFDENSELSLIVLQTGSMVVGKLGDQLTLRATGVPNVVYLLQWSDTLDFEAASSISVTADENGQLEAIVNLGSGPGRMFYRYAYEAGGGEVVP